MSFLDIMLHKYKKLDIKIIKSEGDFQIGYRNLSYKTIIADKGYHWYNKVTNEVFSDRVDLKICFFDTNGILLKTPILESELDYEQRSN